MLNLTPAVRNLIFICVGVYLVDAIFRNMNLAGYLALYKPSTSLFRPYQLFTYMFAHGSLTHLLFNMLTLAMTGSTLEMIWGPQRFLLYYVATGIGAALIYLAAEQFLNPGGLGYMVGASGALYGCLAAFGVLMPDREFQLLIPPVRVKAKYMVFIMGGITYMLDTSGQVAHFAHLGGALIGFILLKVLKF